ncbi:MAG: acetyl/propionyl/methylcrotonyl-CoA carboxylase subunit alpha [Cumulibacter sp.]
MYQKVLIANRGEIAARIIRTCERLGIDTVAVHAPDDADALHVRLATESVLLPGVTPRETYLNIEAIVDAAIRTNCDALHPGYGFLSENPALAQALQDTDICFIGPSASAIATMADKTAARHSALAGDVPLVPGISGDITAERVAEFADQVGWPVLIKAAHGGGGRGMRRVDSPVGIAAALESARNESKHAFGRSEVFVEKLVENARHIEIQILGDRYGSVVSIGSRDCSIQRRHQKILEEAPAPGLSDHMRGALSQAACRLATEVNYLGAGTVEFLLDDDSFYFLEMNTRLQVEHTVTEEVYGLDLVEEQLRLAAGGRVPTEPQARGHAIELRVNAEDPLRSFLPHAGQIERLDFPPMPGLRVDSGYLAGDAVPPNYDSLIAKVIVYGTTRSRALAKLGDVADTAKISGVPSTLALAAWLADSPAFQAGSVSTTWFESVIVPAIDRAAEFVPTPDSDAPGDRGVWIAGRFHRIHGGPNVARPSRSGFGMQSGTTMQAGEISTLVTPMQGTIIRLHASPGDVVSKGTAIATVEAMKLENDLRADFDCEVSEVLVKVGDIITSGTTIAVLAGTA